jgi:hypothetical protein
MSKFGGAGMRVTLAQKRFMLELFMICVNNVMHRSWRQAGALPPRLKQTHKTLAMQTTADVNVALITVREALSKHV